MLHFIQLFLIYCLLISLFTIGFLICAVVLILYKFKQAVKTKEPVWYNAKLFRFMPDDYPIHLLNIDKDAKVISYSKNDIDWEFVEPFENFFNCFIPASIYNNKIYRFFSNHDAMKVDNRIFK